MRTESDMEYDHNSSCDNALSLTQLSTLDSQTTTTPKATLHVSTHQPRSRQSKSKESSPKLMRMGVALPSRVAEILTEELGRTKTVNDSALNIAEKTPLHTQRFGGHDAAAASWPGGR